jgi:DNA polymerase/3'-5' exonuclease PolX
MTETKKDYKELILSQLDILIQNIQQSDDKNKNFKKIAYKKVIEGIKKKNEPINNLEDLSDIKGIGKGIKEKIQQIFDNDIIEQVSLISLVDQEKNNLIELLQGVHGIGLIKAKDLINNHNIKSIEDLKQNKQLLNRPQLIGLKYYEDFKERIKRSEIIKVEKLIETIVEKYDPNLKFSILGSYRREKKESGDIDCLFWHLTRKDDEIIFKDIIKALINEKLIIKEDIIAQGSHKFMGVAKVKNGRKFRRIDLFYTPILQYPFFQLFATGSGQFNIEMRSIALSKGFSLTEKGLLINTGEKKGEYVNHVFNNEKDIFEFLNLHYIEPKDRETGIFNNL